MPQPDPLLTDPFLIGRIHCWTFPDQSDPLLIHQILDWSFTDQSYFWLNLSSDPSDPLLISQRSFTDQSEILYWPITSFTDPWLIARPFFNRSFFPSLEISLPIEGLRISGTKPRHLFAFAATHFSSPFQASTTELEKWHQGEHLVTQETNKIRYK